MTTMHRFSARISLLASAASLFAGADLTAQFVSPVGYATKEGNANSRLPWFDRIRYMQIHGDMRGKARLIKGQSHRRDGHRPTSVSEGWPRTLIVEEYVGAGDLSRASESFAANYTGTRTLVRSSGRLDLPSAITKPKTAPAPFNIHIPYDRPYSYDGNGDLVWELIVTSSSRARNSYWADAVSATGRTVATGSNIGKSCIPPGRRTPTFMLAQAILNTPTNSMELVATTMYGPPNAAGVTLIGLRNPNVGVPGWCGRLHSDGAIVIPGRSQGNGNMYGLKTRMPLQPSAANLDLYFQGVLRDPGQAGLPFTASQGMKLTIPEVPKIGSFANIYYPHPGAYRGLLTRGSALVTRFNE